MSHSNQQCRKTAKIKVVVQFDCHPEQAAFAQAKDLGEPREVSRFLRHNNRALGSLSLSNCATQNQRNCVSSVESRHLIP